MKKLNEMVALIERLAKVHREIVILVLIVVVFGQELVNFLRGFINV